MLDVDVFFEKNIYVFFLIEGKNYAGRKNYGNLAPSGWGRLCHPWGGRGVECSTAAFGICRVGRTSRFVMALECMFSLPSLPVCSAGVGWSPFWETTQEFFFTSHWLSKVTLYCFGYPVQLLSVVWNNWTWWCHLNRSLGRIVREMDKQISVHHLASPHLEDKGLVRISHRLCGSGLGRWTYYTG